MARSTAFLCDDPPKAQLDLTGPEPPISILLLQRKFFHAQSNTVRAIRQKFALLNSKASAPILNLLGFSDYRYRLIEFSKSRRG
jgi:hypothetical protein